MTGRDTGHPATIGPVNLVELGPGVYALIDPVVGYGHTNIGVVVEDDGVTIVDTGPTPTVGARAKVWIDELAEPLGLRIKRVVLTSSRVVHTGGSNPFWAAAFYGTETTSDQLDQPPNPEAFRRLLPEHAAAYDEEFTNRPVTHLVSEAALITPACHAIPLRGESAENLVVYVESAGVVFAGALAGFRVTPLGYDGYLHDWIDSIEQLGQLAPTVIPGHGPPGGRADLADQADYLRACLRASARSESLEPGPWDGWSDRRFDPVNTERARLLAAGRDEPPQAMFALLGFG